MWFLFILVFHSKFFCSNPLPASLVVRGKVLSLPSSLFFLLLYNSSVSARTAIAGRRSLPLQNSSPWLCSDDSTWGERRICCYCCRLTTVVSSSYPLCLWVRVWGNVFWHDTERPTAGAAVHILLPEKKGQKNPEKHAFDLVHMKTVSGWWWVESSVTYRCCSANAALCAFGRLCQCLGPNYSAVSASSHYICPFLSPHVSLIQDIGFDTISEKYSDFFNVW